MSIPPVPPRPYSAAPQDPYSQPSPPHFTDPLVAPRPHRVDPSIGMNMARDLDNTLASTPPRTSSAMYYQQPQTLSPPMANQASPQWSPWAPAPNPSLTPAPPMGRTPSPMPMRLPSPPRDGNLTVPLPSLSALQSALGTVTNPNHDPALQLAWARDVLFLVDRTPSLAASPLVAAAVPLVFSLCSASPPPPEAVYLRATFCASSAPPALSALTPGGAPNPRSAFRDFEAAARAGYAPAWFRLARDYEAFADFPHALDCLRRGAKAGDAASLQRLGTAHLLGQLGLQASPEEALNNLSRAAVRASLQCAAPAYVFALLLLGEFTTSGSGPEPARPVGVPPQLLPAYLPAGQSKEAYARALLERAAALHFAPAQYKLGHAFEFAVPVGAFPFDPLLSVQWYSLASQAGEAEADMALSKWFLCGAEGAFDKDESLARTFAGKAAAKGLASGEFAMGYYAEVGIGGGVDVAAARGWYEKAAAHGNNDAKERLKALALAVPQTLGRTEHDALTGDKLVRKRTQARMRSNENGLANPYPEPESPYDAPNPHPPYGVSAPQPGNPYGVPPGAQPAAPYGAPAPGPAGGRPPPPQGQGQFDPSQRRTRVMELARKSSLMEGSSGGYNRPGSASAGRGRGGMPMPAVQEQGHRREGSLPPPQQQRPPMHSRESSLAPPAAGRGAGRGYSLADPGSASAGPRPSSAAGPGPGGRAPGTPPNRRTPLPTTAPDRDEGIATPVGGGGPATFAEMGFTGAKAEERDCVIM
ncbi:hypothetical protein FB45DRAFT_957597 [Roridomyces roridus]|uniref:HCP-like protein n=1 Tax=Roridomyces roridus TaxID=1738132 RepID=A0AAD7AYW7_9AGAR|nr:hypothetical protein FB45DRAFT_957597 [Roridomyces roridus]